MNQRIKELSEQAGHKPLGTFADELMEIYNKKFAELIVRECIGVLEGTLGMNNSTLQNMDAIKEHFGVE